MKRFLVLTISACLAFMLVTSPALAGDHGMGTIHGFGFCPCNLKELKLTAEQEKQIAGLKVALKKQAAPARAAISIKRAELKTLWMADKPNRSAILAKKAEILAQRKKIYEAKVDFRLEFMKILTKKQKKMIRGWLGKKCTGHGHGHGEGHGHGHGKGHGKVPCKHGH